MRMRRSSWLLLSVLLLLGCRDCLGNDWRGYEECSAECPWQGECKWDRLGLDTGADTGLPDEDVAWEACDWCCKQEYLHLR